MNSEDEGSDSGIEAISYKVITVDVIEISDSESDRPQQGVDKAKETPSSPELAMRRKINTQNSTRIEDFFKSPTKEKSNNDPKPSDELNQQSGQRPKNEQRSITEGISTKRRYKNEGISAEPTTFQKNSKRMSKSDDISTENRATMSRNNSKRASKNDDISTEHSSNTSQKNSKKRSSELPWLPVDKIPKSSRTENEQFDLDQLTHAAVQAERMRLIEQQRKEKRDESTDATKTARKWFTDLYCDKRFKRGRRNGQFIVNDASLRTRLHDLAIFHPAPKFDINCGAQSEWSFKMWPLIFKTKIPYEQLPSIEDPRFEWLQYAMCSEDNDQVRQKYCDNWIRIIHKELDNDMSNEQLTDVMLQVASHLGVPSSVLNGDGEAEPEVPLFSATGIPYQQIPYHSGIEEPHIGIVASVLQALADLIIEGIKGDWIDPSFDYRSPERLVLKLLILGAVDFQMEPVRSCIQDSFVKFINGTGLDCLDTIYFSFENPRFWLRILECVKGSRLHKALAESYFCGGPNHPDSSYSLRDFFLDQWHSTLLFNHEGREIRAEDKHMVVCLLHYLDGILHEHNTTESLEDIETLERWVGHWEGALRNLQSSEHSSLGLMSALHALIAIVQTADPVTQYDIV